MTKLPARRLSRWPTVAIVLNLWAVTSVIGAIDAAEQLAWQDDVTLDEALRAAAPYFVALALLVVASLAGVARRDPLSAESRFVRLGLVIAFVAGLSAWVLVAYAAALGERWPIR